MPVTAEGRPIRQVVRAESRLNITVVFTSNEGTLTALRTAGTLAKQLNGRITIVVPQVVSYQLPLNEPPVSEEWSRRHFHVLAEGCPVETAVRLYLCRDSWETLNKVLKPHSLVVVGRGNHWWSAENRLARRLRRAGYEVVLAETEQNND